MPEGLIFQTALTIRREPISEDVTRGLPADLASVLHDQSVIVPQDAAVFVLIAAWAKRADPDGRRRIIVEPDMGLVEACTSSRGWRQRRPRFGSRYRLASLAERAICQVCAGVCTQRASATRPTRMNRLLKPNRLIAAALQGPYGFRMLRDCKRLTACRTGRRSRICVDHVCRHWSISGSRRTSPDWAT